MAGCCDDGCGLDVRQSQQRRTLRWVLAVNAIMFLVIAAAALVARSSSLLSDCLDNLGDAITYGLSLFAVARGSVTKSRVALWKGGLILLGAIGVGAQVVHRLVDPTVPIFTVMGGFALAGLAANGACLYLLSRHRHEDINMASVWECSRNDIVSNLSVLIAAIAVRETGRGWPDLVVAAALVLILGRSAIRVLRSARHELSRAASISRTPPGAVS